MGALKIAFIVLLISIIIALLVGRKEILSVVISPWLMQILSRYFPISLVPHIDSLSPVPKLHPLTPPITNGRIYSKEELALYDGSPGSPGLKIAIIGQVFDVSKGEKHYGPGGGYNFFAAIDGSRAFLTGEFNEAGLIDNLDDITPMQAGEMNNWLDFYHKDYTCTGVVVGEFYDEAGKHKTALVELAKLVRESVKIKTDKEADEKRFPSCNSHWTKEEGTTLWCSDKSGGVERDWVGVPRLYKAPGDISTRCACIRTIGPSSEANIVGNRGDLDSPNIKVYKGCDETSVSCKIIK